MKWIASHRSPPIYIWHDDEWYNETDKKTYIPNFNSMCWECGGVKFPFTKKVYIESMSLDYFILVKDSKRRNPHYKTHTFLDDLNE